MCCHCGIAVTCDVPVLAEYSHCCVLTRGLLLSHASVWHVGSLWLLCTLRLRLVADRMMPLLHTAWLAPAHKPWPPGPIFGYCTAFVGACAAWWGCTCSLYPANQRATDGRHSSPHMESTRAALPTAVAAHSGAFVAAFGWGVHAACPITTASEA